MCGIGVGAWRSFVLSDNGADRLEISEERRENASEGLG